MDSVTAKQPRQKARRRRNGNNGDNGNDNGDGDEDNGDGDGWRNGDGRRGGNTTAMAAMGGATAHNW